MLSALRAVRAPGLAQRPVPDARLVRDRRLVGLLLAEPLNLQARRERIEGEAIPAAGGGRGGGRGAGAGAPGGAGGQAAGFAFSQAGAGTYRVVLSVGGREYTQTAHIVADPAK